MQYAVTIRKRGEPKTVLEQICGENEIDLWCSRAKSMANERNTPMTVTFRPREFEFDYEPESKNRVRSKPPPRTDDSPSVCELLNRGD